MNVVARAQSRLGEDRYRILTNNCEHFCTWCVQGFARSEQVRRCLTHPWLGIATLRVLARRSRAFRHWASRISCVSHRFRSSIATHCFVDQLRRA
ncbi:lecithin retinol acyltransferase family protein [Trinickia sp. NRRL B-1857]